MFFLCFNTLDGTWHYYINIEFVITRKGSQYFCRSLAWVQARWGCWMFTCCVWRFLWFYLYIFDFYFFFHPIREKSDCDADMMNVLEPGFFLVISLSEQILRLIGAYWLSGWFFFYCFQFEEIHTFALRRKSAGVFPSFRLEHSRLWENGDFICPLSDV